MVHLMQSCSGIIRTVNLVYTVFSFIGFIMCAIPFYWHFEAWNAGTCLYMAWIGLGCLIQCINSIVWNKNTINKAPLYCDIIIHVQNGIGVAIPACQLCIGRRLYRIAMTRAVIVTRTEKRRAIILDLLIGIGIPVLRMIAVHVVLENRYVLFEDFGPFPSIAIMPPSFFLDFIWPLAIGCVSLVYCLTNIYTFYKYSRQVRPINPAISRGQYFRLMAFFSIEMFAGIPLETYEIVAMAMADVVPWKSWADTHRHYSQIPRIPAVIWKNDPKVGHQLEMYRWSLVACAFFFFAFFGFADEARQHYRLVYTWLVSRIRCLTSPRTPRGTPDVTVTLPQMERTRGITDPQAMATIPADERDETFSSTDLPSTLSSSLATNLEPSFTIEASSSSVDNGLKQGLED